MDRLFVYGSLQPGAPNAHVVDGAGSWASGTVVGVLDDAGWGSALGYPGLRSVGDGSPVRGFVLSAQRLPWDVIDAFEGDDYERISTIVDLDDGSAVDAFVFVLARRVISS